LKQGGKLKKKTPEKEDSSQKIKVVIFDCDGVLFDSKDANIRFYNSILERFGKPPLKDSQIEYVHMHSLADSIRYLFPEKNLEEVLDYCRKLDFKDFNKYLKVQEGLVDFLEYLRPKYKTAIATNRTVSMAMVLEEFKLQDYFDLVVTAADVKRPKPYPETIEKILDTFKIEPGEAVFIGDSEVDKQLADNTGVIFISYKNPDLTTRYHVTSFEEVKDLLEHKLNK